MNNITRNIYISNDGNHNENINSFLNSIPPRSRHYSGSVQRPASLINGIRELIGRPRSESVGNYDKHKIGCSPINKNLRRVQIENCPVESVYDLREEDETNDVYTDSLAFRRPRSNSSDFLILRKTSRPLSVDVLGLVDDHSDPYKQYMRVVDCYELAPHTGSVILLDGRVKLEKAFRTLSEWCVGSALVWSEVDQRVISILTITDFINSLFSDCSISNKTVFESISTNRLVTLDASSKLLNACEEFYSNRVHRIAITEPSGDILFMLTIKRILQAIHKQNRSLHFAMWLGCEIRSAHIGTWDNIHTVNEHDMLEESVKKMIDYRISSIPIVDSNDRPIDVLCKWDVATTLAEAKDIQENFHNIMTSDAVTYRQPATFLTDVDTVATVLDLALNQKDCRCVFIKDSLNDKIRAAVSLSDFISYILTHKHPLNPEDRKSVV